MAWTAVDDFNSYSDGDLNTLNGGTGWNGAWSGSSNFDVQGSTVYEGSKAVTNTVSSNISRSLTTPVSGDGNVMYIAMRKTTNNDGGMRLLLDSAGDRRVSISFNSGGNILGEATTITSYSANTWYVLRITLNTDANTYTVATSTGAYGSASTFSADSSAIAMTGASGGDIATVIFDVDVGGDAFYDYISGTSPFGESSQNANWYM